MNDKFETWAIVELFGHSKIAGKVAEQQIAGGTFLRVDVPDLDGQPKFTRFYGASAIYSITPTSEEIANRAAEAMKAQPITVYGIVLPERQLELGASEDEPRWNEETNRMELNPPAFGDLRDEEYTYDEDEGVPF